MKVKELIAKLQKLPENLDVMVGVSDWVSEPSDFGVGGLELGIWDDECEYTCEETNDVNEATAIIIRANF